MPNNASAQQVAYKAGGDNTILRMVLHRVWDTQCWLCVRPVVFRDVQIDHLIAQRGGGDIQTLLENFDLPSTFDLNDPSNLAPICGPCNLEKGNRQIASTRLSLILERAAAKRGRVVREVEHFNLTKSVSPALLKLVEADLESPDVRSVFVQWAPIIGQRLADIDPQLADFVTTRVLAPFELWDGIETVSLDLQLQERGRAAIDILENGLRLDLQLVFESIARKSIEVVVNAAQDQVASLSDTDPGEGVVTALDLDLDVLDFSLMGSIVRISARTTIRLTMTASIVEDAPDGDGLVDRQGEAFGTAACDADVVADFERPRSYEIEHLGLDDQSLEIETWVE